MSKKKAVVVASEMKKDLLPIVSILQCRDSVSREEISNLDFKKFGLSSTLQEKQGKLEELCKKECAAMKELKDKLNEFQRMRVPTPTKQDVVNFMKENWELKRGNERELEALNTTISEVRMKVCELQKEIDDLNLFQREIRSCNEQTIKKLVEENESVVEKCESTIRHLENTHQKFLEASNRMLDENIRSVKAQTFNETYEPLQKWFQRDRLLNEILKKELDITTTYESNLRKHLKNLQKNVANLSEEEISRSTLRNIYPKMFTEYDLTGKENLRKDTTLNLQFEKYFQQNENYITNSIFNNNCFDVHLVEEVLDQFDDPVDAALEIRSMKEGACSSNLDKMLRCQYEDEGWDKVLSLEPWDRKLLIVSGSAFKLEEPPTHDEHEEKVAATFDPRKIEFPSKLNLSP